MGEAGSREIITPEQAAFNQIQARIPDNQGQQPDGPIAKDQSAQAEAGINAATVSELFVESGWAASLSTGPGRFVCNFLAYQLYTGNIPALFIHVPALRSTGRATVSGETDANSRSPVAIGQLPRTFSDLADAIAVVIQQLPAVLEN